MRDTEIDILALISTMSAQVLSDTGKPAKVLVLSADAHYKLRMQMGYSTLAPYSDVPPREWHKQTVLGLPVRILHSLMYPGFLLEVY